MPFHSQKGHQTEPWFWLLDSIMLQNPSKQVFHRHLRKFQDSSSSMKEELYNGWLEINASCFPTSFYTNASRWYNEGCCRNFTCIIGKLDHDECEAQKWQRAARYNDKPIKGSKAHSSDVHQHGQLLKDIKKDDLLEKKVLVVVQAPMQQRRRRQNYLTENKYKHPTAMNV